MLICPSRKFKGLCVKIHDQEFLLTEHASYVLLMAKVHAFKEGLGSIDDRDLLYAVAIYGDDLLDESVARKVLKDLDVDLYLAGKLIYHRVQGGDERTSIDKLGHDFITLEIMKQAKKEAKRDGEKYIWSYHILLALFDNYGSKIVGNTQPDGLLKQHLGLCKTKVRQKANQVIRKEKLTEHSVK